MADSDKSLYGYLFNDHVSPGDLMRRVQAAFRKKEMVREGGAAVFSYQV